MALRFSPRGGTVIRERLDLRSCTVREARPRELPALYASLARAFEDDPVTRHLFPDRGTRVRRLQAFYRSMMPTLVAHGRMYADADLRGAAIWQAPLPPSPGPAQLLSTMLRSALALRGRALAGLALGRALEAVHERKPHWYLAILGTDPEYQGKGIGRALLAPVLDLCDREGELAYLESSKRRNLSFYEHHGFEVVQEVRLQSGLVLWPMLRRPRAPGATG